MSLVLRAGIAAGLMIAAGSLLVGCRSTTSSAPAPIPLSRSSTTNTAKVAQSAPPPANAITPVGYERPAPAKQHEIVVVNETDGLFAGEAELNQDRLLALVCGRNASLEAMSYAWRAATQRYPQAISLDDPVFMGMIAPASVGSSQVETAYQVGGSQKLPWFGKRALRGSAAQADANAMFHDLRDARLALAQTTRLAFYEYYLLQRQIELNQQSYESLERFRQTAQVKYENNQVTEQDTLQADVELAGTERRKIELERMYRVAIARINTLLRRNPSDTLPAPPAELGEVSEPPPADLLRQMAATQRPDLAAIAARVRAEEAAVELALKQYYPDTEIYGRYDSFWQPAATQSDLRGQVGVNVNMPIYRRKLQAAVCEAQFRANQRRAEYRQKMADIQFEVQAAYEQIVEARRAEQIYREKLLPAAEQNVDVARTNYEVGKITFLNVLVAQQQLIAQREQYQQALAAYHSRLAELERVVAGPLPEMAKPEEIHVPATR